MSITDEHQPDITLAVTSDGESDEITPDWGTPLAQGIPLDISDGDDIRFATDHEYHVNPGQYLADVHRQGADQLKELHWNGLVDENTHGIEKRLVTLRHSA